MNVKSFQRSIKAIGENLGPNEDWMPTMILEKRFNGEDHTAIIGLTEEFMKDQETKDDCAVLMTETIAKNKPDAVCFISTCWTLIMDKDHGPTQEEIQKTIKAGLSKHPKRVEVVLCICCGERGEAEGESMMMGFIKRSRSHPVIERWDIQMIGGDNAISGRFIEAIREGFKQAKEENETRNTT